MSVPQLKPNAPPSRRWYVAGAVAIGVVALAAFMVTRRDIRTRQVRYKGELCTEYFDTKDGMEVRAVCPSHGGEWYVDTSRTIQYAPRFPVERSTKPSNDR
jgi:hypothetical protein